MDSQYDPPLGLPPGIEQEPESDSGLTEKQLLQLVTDIKDYQITHGNLLKLIRFEEPTRVPAAGTAVSVLPTSFPRRCFDEAWELQKSMNELYIRAASDEEWLYSVLQPLLEHDDFLAALWDVHIKVKEAGVVQNTVCGVFRSDYMLHQPSVAQIPSLKQVEMNNLAVAGACHAARVAKMHRHLQQVRDSERHFKECDLSCLPSISDNVKSIAMALTAARHDYISISLEPKCILMIVQPFNFNIADERPIEYALWEAGIPCYRCEWYSVLERTTLTDGRTLMYRPFGAEYDLEVTVVYYRAGYEAAEYDDHGKETRLRLEMSRAIKCPDVMTHLTTFKAVQQALTQAGALERLLSRSNYAGRVEDIRGTFMPMYALDTSAAGLESRKIATDPTQAVDYVLKPNLEGGGNNVYRADIPTFLASIPEEQWHKFVLMRLIEPPKETQGLLMTGEELYEGPVVSELGILGTVMWKRKSDGETEVLRNEAAGWTFKTKPRDVDEMSVVKGYGCFDCPRLVD